jgi:hypothetical protein
MGAHAGRDQPGQAQEPEEVGSEDWTIGSQDGASLVFPFPFLSKNMAVQAIGCFIDPVVL